MDNKSKLTLVSILLSIIAIVMIVLGVTLKIAAPALTGTGFLLIAWALRLPRD